MNEVSLSGLRAALLTADILSFPSPSSQEKILKLIPDESAEILRRWSGWLKSEVRGSVPPREKCIKDLLMEHRALSSGRLPSLGLGIVYSRREISGVQLVPLCEEPREMHEGLLDLRFGLFGHVWQWPHHSQSGWLDFATPSPT